MSKHLWSGVSGCIVLGLIGCVSHPPPYEDYAMARAAVKAARDVDSSRYSPEFMNQAELSFRMGEKNYKEDNFDEAHRNFQKAIKSAERAENGARVKRFITGGEM